MLVVDNVAEEKQQMLREATELNHRRRPVRFVHLYMNARTRYDAIQHRAEEDR